MTAQTAWDNFIQQGLPHRQQERWKYADLSSLQQQILVAVTPVSLPVIKQSLASFLKLDDYVLVMVNGFFLRELSVLPENVLLSSPPLHTTAWESLDLTQHPFVTLNQAMPADGFTLTVPDHVQVDQPIYVLSMTLNAQNALINTRHAICLGKQSEITLIEKNIALHSDNYLVNQTITINLAEEASLKHCKVQDEALSAFHVANTVIAQHRYSRCALQHFSLGSIFARDDVTVLLKENGAHCETNGLYVLKHDQQYIDHHVDIMHQAPHTQSAMLYKGILNKKSRAVFNGKVAVAPHAQKITAHQANHNLLLSPLAEVYTKPELEIDADDVKCKHGATVGQLDNDALFYLRSRGVTLAEAHALLLQGFAVDLIERMPQQTLQEEMHTRLA